MNENIKATTEDSSADGSAPTEKHREAIKELFRLWHLEPIYEEQGARILSEHFPAEQSAIRLSPTHGMYEDPKGKYTIITDALLSDPKMPWVCIVCGTKTPDAHCPKCQPDTAPPKDDAPVAEVIAAIDLCISKGLHALTWSVARGGTSCDGHVSYIEAAEWHDEGEEALLEAASLLKSLNPAPSETEKLREEECHCGYELELRYISEVLLGTKIEGDVTYNMIGALVEGEIDRQADRANNAESQLETLKAERDSVQNENYRLICIISGCATGDQGSLNIAKKMVADAFNEGEALAHPGQQKE